MATRTYQVRPEILRRRATSLELISRTVGSSAGGESEGTEAGVDVSVAMLEGIRFWKRPRTRRFGGHGSITADLGDEQFPNGRFDLID